MTRGELRITIESREHRAQMPDVGEHVHLHLRGIVVGDTVDPVDTTTFSGGLSYLPGQREVVVLVEEIAVVAE